MTQIPKYNKKKSRSVSLIEDDDDLGADKNEDKRVTALKNFRKQIIQDENSDSEDQLGVTTSFKVTYILN